MTSILIATDFSLASQNAMEYGFQLANSMGVPVHLIHATYEFPEGVIISKDDELEKYNLELLRKEASNFKTGDVPVYFSTANGKPVETIIDLACKLKCDLIVTGMKGTGKTTKRLFGSTATGLVKAAGIPLVIVPENARWTDPKNIVLANDFGFDTGIQSLDKLIEIGEHFNSRLFIVRVITPGLKEQEEREFHFERFAKNLRNLKPVYEFPVGASVGEAINDFSRMNNINMVAVISRKHNFIEQLFVHSHTRELIFTTHIPILALPEVRPEC